MAMGPSGCARIAGDLRDRRVPPAPGAISPCLQALDPAQHVQVPS